MGKQAEEALDLDHNQLADYLYTNHSVYMQVGSALYYLTDVNSQEWRAQDTSKHNEKGHYVDCSELVNTMSEFLDLPFHEGKSVNQLFDDATFYASMK